MPSLKEQGIKAFIWDFSGKLARNGMDFVVTIFLARLLAPSDFGLIAIIMVIVGIASVFIDIGLGSALIQRRRVLSIHYSSVFYFNISIGLLLTLLTYFSAPWVSEFYSSEELLLLTQVMSLLFILGALGSVQSTRLRKELNYALLTKIELISSLISGVIGVSLAILGAGVWSLVAQSILRVIIYNIIIFTSTKWVPDLKFSWKALTQLWGFGFRMFLVGLLNAIYIRLDYLFIGKLFPMATLGYYQRAKSLEMMAIQYSSGSLMSVLFPVLSKVQNDLPQFQNIIIKALGIISFVVFLLFGSLYLVAEELIVILFSETWLPSVEYFKILVFSGFAYPINALLVNVLSSRGNSKAFLRMAIYKKSVAFLNFGTFFLFGIEGFLYGLIVVSIITTSITIVITSREASIAQWQFYKLIIVQSIMGAIALLITLCVVEFLPSLTIISFMIKLILFSMVYILFNYLFKTLSFLYFLEQFLPVFKKLSNKIIKR